MNENNFLFAQNEEQSTEEATENLSTAVNYFIHNLNLGLMTVTSHIYREFAGLTYKDLTLIVKHLDADTLYMLVSSGHTYKEAIAKLLDYRITRLKQEGRKPLMKRIIDLTEEQAMELAYRIYAAHEVLFFLRDEVNNLF